MNMFVSSVLIDVYCKCNFIQDVRFVFEEVNDKDVVVWNVMFFGYVQQLESEEVFKFYI